MKYVPLPHHQSQLSTSELKHHLHGHDDTTVIRSLLIAELAHCKKTTIEYRSMRGLWYASIKPALSRIGMLDANYYAQFKRRGRQPKQIKVPDLAAKLSAVLWELVRETNYNYADWRVIDTSRSKRAARPLAMDLHPIEVTGDANANVILYTEKDTIYSLLENIACIYGCSVASGGGQPSAAASEHLLRTIGQSDEIVIIGMTDYDPSGYSIFDTFVGHVRELFSGKVTAVRLGVEPSQFTQEQLGINGYSPSNQTGKQFKSWFNSTGGINGEPLGLELDAMPLNEIRSLFINALEKRIDRDAVADHLYEHVIEMEVDLAIEDDIERLRIEAREKLNGYRFELKKGAIRNAALSGQQYVNYKRAISEGDLIELREKLNGR